MPALPVALTYISSEQKRKTFLTVVLLWEETFPFIPKKTY